jgi:hypothetical protein
MRKTELNPGWYRARFPGGSQDYVRFERIAAPRYEGDAAVVVVTRFQVRGAFEARLRAAEILEPVEPGEKFLRFVALIEEAAAA